MSVPCILSLFYPRNSNHSSSQALADNYKSFPTPFSTQPTPTLAAPSILGVSPRTILQSPKHKTPDLCPTNPQSPLGSQGETTPKYINHPSYSRQCPFSL
ncbi:BA75_00923T0 [Komagataella pastoris]|uniref:BA75_00923T0 n=1 Tax=Komagataella pastoris TaxID=4922 RepID=A0A1B2J9S6_PICPA|nr:BA75_00923T0 [Komagataella pastoris]